MQDLFGPISRIDFIWRTVGLLGIGWWAAGLLQGGQEKMGLVLAVGSSLAFIAQGIKRARGMGLSGLWGLLLMIPLVQVLAWLAFACVPSKGVPEAVAP